MYCSGGHGLSIGSVGGRTDNVVSNVTFTDSVVVNSQNGVRIKTVYNATGTVSDVRGFLWAGSRGNTDEGQVTYANIALWNISNYGVVIEQDYENGSPTGVVRSSAVAPPDFPLLIT
jgi:polygalacturonase